MGAAALKGRPLNTAFYRHASVRRALRGLIATYAPDLLYCHGIGGATLLEGLVEPSRVLLDLDNAEHSRYALIAQTTSGWRAWQWRLDVDRVERWMRHELARYGAVALASERDLRQTADVAPEAKYLLVPNGTEVPPTPRADPGRAGAIVFVGDQRYRPNAEAVTWFASEVLPQIQGQASLRVVGGRDTPARPSGVVYVGEVPSLDVEWRAATIAVVPLLAGAGSPLKLVEALAWGVPVVATPIAAEGLPVVDGEHLIIAEGADRFAAGVTRLLHDPALRRRLSLAGHELARSQFAWPVAVSELLAFVRSSSPEGRG
jgi:hypothetical protein